MLPWNNRLPHGSFFNFNFCFGQTNVKSKDLTLDRPFFFSHPANPSAAK